MAPFPTQVTLGRSGLVAGPLGVSGSFGIDARSLRRAFDRGVTYFYHGTRRRPGMAQAIRELCAAGERDRLVVLLQSYARFGWQLERGLVKGLRELGLERADVLLLGWHNQAPSPRILERAERLREKGLYRVLAVSGHNRRAFPGLAIDHRYGLFHIRYNAAHPGADTDIFPFLSREGRPGFVAYTATAWRKLLDPKHMPPGEKPLRPRDCYRFALSSPSIDVCMTGPKDAAEMDEALSALDEGPLSAEEEERIRRIGKHVRGR